MTEKENFVINDDLFLNTVSCPLKLYHLTEEKLQDRNLGSYFRRRNKLHVRDAIALRFENCKHTSNSTLNALEETSIWLKQSKVAVCGAVVRNGDIMTRIPILLKEGKQLTIIQVHGKLRKSSETDEIKPGVRKRSTVGYLLKAAYRMEVLNRKFPDYEINVHFFFPNKHFKSSAGNLNLFHQPPYLSSEKIQNQLFDLFLKVEATKATKWVQKEIPSSHSHKIFNQISVSSAIEKISMIKKETQILINIDRQKSCKYCAFRLSESSDRDGCWSRFFATDDIQNPEKHVYELIGHGNHLESEKGSFYQEQADITGGFENVRNMTEQKYPKIPILYRRNLQILKARNLDIPNLWLKKNIDTVNNLHYPLHFLDFEAATYALPMEKLNRPYSSVYFQFSCHTLYENGDLVHTEWLDLQNGDIHPHQNFTRALGNIPDIVDGTIMQYSPFEKQGVNRLIADFNRNTMEYAQEIDILESIRQSKSSFYEHRFFDVSKLIREYYFNKYLDDSLGLKQVLKSIIKWERANHSGSNDFFDQQMTNILFGNNQADVEALHSDPYLFGNDSNVTISNGSEAMHAWLSYKMGLLTEEESEKVPSILKKYCSLDSYALFVIYKHIKKFTGLINGSDYILYD